MQIRWIQEQSRQNDLPGLQLFYEPRPYRAGFLFGAYLADFLSGMKKMKTSAHTHIRTG